jgi:release factor glutamine methyltransferase
VTIAPTVGGALAQSGLVPVDARALMMHVLGVDRAWLVAHDRDALSAGQAQSFFALSRRRRDGEPVAYLVGRREFFGLDLAVTPAVLIPRPETEVVVEAALARLIADRPAGVLDLGTGSGAIALAIANARPRVGVVATDASDAALDVARGNAQRLGIVNVDFVRADWYDGVPSTTFDIIVSNPPYVDPRDPYVGQGDLRFEPRAALVPGTDPLAALKAIVLDAPSRLHAGGALIVEHGHDQSAAVCGLFETAGFEGVRRLRDLAGIDRVVVGCRGPSSPAALRP